MATVMVYVVDSFPARPKNKRTHHAQLTSPSRASCHGPSLAKCLLICSCRPACRGDGPMGPPLLLLRLCMVLVGYSISWLDIRFDIYIFDSDLGCLAATLDSILSYFGFSPKGEDCEEERQHSMCRERRRQAEVCSFSSCYSLLQLCRLCGNRGTSNAWLEASFGGSDPPSLKSSPISRCREPAHAKFLVELAGAMAWRAAARARHDALRLLAHFWRNPGCCHCLGSAALSIIKPRIPRLQQLFALSAR